ncbi:MAG: aromatic amino acid transport family protein [Candidatus Pacearchaeota archaeon]
MKRGSNVFWEAVATLIGTIIGAGIFGIPYVVAKAGFLVGFINLVILGLVILMINLYLGEICLRTKEVHQLAGLAELYLGKIGKTVMAFSSFFGIVGALIAYLIGEGEVLSAIFGGNPFFFSILFFVIASILIYFDLSAIKKAEFYLSFFMVLLIVVIIVISLTKINIDNLMNFDLSKLFLPYGVILFAFIGAAAIPEMEIELKQNKKLLKKAIIIGSLIPFFIYLLFTIAVVGATGIHTTEIATIGLGNLFGRYMVLFGNLFPVFSMSTSFLILGLALKWMLHYDYKINKTAAWLLTCSIPLIAFLAGARSFINVIGITGAIAGGIEGILIVLITKKAKEKGKIKPEYDIPLRWVFAIILILLFVAGMIYQFVKF